MNILITAVVILQLFLPRIQSINRMFTMPVAGNVLGSDSNRHIARGSVRAFDMSAPYGSYIYAPADGVVLYSGCNNAGNYGCWMLLDHRNGYKSILAHFAPDTMQCKAGDAVTVNSILGTVGSTGLTSYSHTHWELSYNDVRQRLENYFDVSQLRDYPVRSIPGEPWIAKGTTISYSNSIPNFGNAWFAIAAIVAYLVFWFFHEHKRTSVAIVHNAFAIVFVLHLPLILPMVSSAMPTAYTAFHGDKFEYTYRFVQRWEGTARKCVHDPVRTLNGITQGTYDRYRQEQGLQRADVCTALTDAQAKDIYYRYYYLASGANNLPVEMALHQFDFAVNAGTGAAKKAFAECGNDFSCYTRYRLSFYQQARLCYLYCKAWFNRVNDVTAYLRGIT